MQDGERDWKVDEATALLRELFVISDEFERRLGDALAVNPTDLQAMEHLLANGPSSPTDLARSLRLSTAATTTVIDRLARAGHAERRANPDDRRGVVVVPSPASVDRTMAHLVPMILGIDGVLDDFDAAERDVITRYLRAVVARYRRSLDDFET